MTQAMLKLRLRGDVEAWSSRLRVSPRRIRIQRMTRKWASCSSRGTLTFSLDLLRQPAGFRRYVIVHELLHLRLPNHGRLFKALMLVHVPNWKRVRPSRG